MKYLILLLLIYNDAFGQPTHGPEIVFTLADSGKVVPFDSVSENNDTIITDVTNRYTIKSSYLGKKDCGFIAYLGTNCLHFRIHPYKNTYEIYTSIDQCDTVVLEITRKSKLQIDTMNIKFYGIFHLSAKLDIQFRPGVYAVDAKRLYIERKRLYKHGYEPLYIEYKNFIKERD